MPAFCDLTGQTFGRLTVMARDANMGNKVAWMCFCECGVEKTIRASDLRQGRVVSCGCYRKDGPRRVHGAAPYNGKKAPEYNSWLSMKARCTNPNAFGYDRYGGRGITVCDRWLNDFSAFFADMGDRPSYTSLDRIDNDGNYEPGNCRWATPAEQAANRTWNPRSAWASDDDRDELGRFRAA